MSHVAFSLASRTSSRLLSNLRGGRLALSLVAGAMIVAASPADAAAAIPGQLRFTKTFGAFASDVQPAATALDLEGNILWTGALSGAVDLGGGVLTSAGGSDIVVAKLDSQGNPLWSKRFGDAADHQAGASIKTDLAGNIYITGTYEGTVDFGGGTLVATTDAPADPASTTTGIDVFVVKLDRHGNHLWSKSFSGQGYQTSSSLGLDLFGNVYIGGAFNGAVDFGGGTRSCVGVCTTSGGLFNGFVVKLDSQGHYLSDRVIGSDAGGKNGVWAMAVDLLGTTYVAGNFNGTIDLGGGPLVGPGVQDVFVAKYDAAGHHVWSKSFGQTGYDFMTGLAVDLQGSPILYGQFTDSINFGGGDLVPDPGSFGGANADLFLAKLDRHGNHLWSQRFGDGGIQSAGGVAVDLEGNIGITGGLGGVVDFGGGPRVGGFFFPLAFAAKLDRNGHHVWSHVATSGSSFVEFQTGTSVAFDLGGNLAVTGTFLGTLDFGNGGHTSGDPFGGFSTFVARFKR